MAKKKENEEAKKKDNENLDREKKREEKVAAANKRENKRKQNLFNNTQTTLNSDILKTKQNKRKIKENIIYSPISKRSYSVK